MREHYLSEPAQIGTKQKILREAYRGALHYPILRNTTVNAVDYGLPRLKHEFLDKKKGVITIAMHFSQADPVWSINDTTEERKYRNVPISGPIAKHQAFPGLVKLVSHAGIDLTSVVTSETIKKAQEKGNPKKLTRGDGLRNYIEQSAETIRKGGIVFVSPNATRNPNLVKDEQGVVTGLLTALAIKKVTKFGIHFVAFEIEGLQDYSKKKGYNFFSKYKVIHGNTYSIDEFMILAAGEIIDGETKLETHKRAVRNIESTVFSELGRIAPSAYLLKT